MKDCYGRVTNSKGLPSLAVYAEAGAVCVDVGGDGVGLFEDVLHL